MRCFCPRPLNGGMVIKMDCIKNSFPLNVCIFSIQAEVGEELEYRWSFCEALVKTERCLTRPAECFQSGTGRRRSKNHIHQIQARPRPGFPICGEASTR